MSLLPVLHPALLALIVLPVLALAIWALVRARSVAARTTWALRVLLVLACGVLALRPGIPDGSAATVTTNVDVFLVVDSTTSMTAEDWAGDAARLEGVRQDARAIVDAYPGARFSLITFDNSAQQRLPLTTDQNAVLSALEVLTPPATAYAAGSSIALAAPLLAETVQAAAEGPDADGRARMAFYLGDGEQTTAREPESFAPAAEWIDGGAVLGYGTAEGGPMPEFGDGTEDPPYIQHEGETALSTIDEASLETIADQLGVPYAHRTADSDIALPAAPEETTAVTGDETLGARTELSWAVAIVVSALLLSEVALGAARLRATLRSTRPAKETR
ncbi:VWA domain-containing protein [Microbacterium sp. G2-8]|uniref:VWA domain-containing protein n=1 Tax=Microbacterium sp. G2-8 TaxID=2842454 RepID=UPI001C8A963F|nr:VWA domain-containing protein [Microbacterium sp. G2-8]